MADQENTVVSKEEVQSEEKPVQQRLVDVELSSENVALNVLVGFCNMAQQRGAFNIEESAKIWECIKLFQKKSA